MIQNINSNAEIIAIEAKGSAHSAHHRIDEQKTLLDSQGKKIESIEHRFVKHDRECLKRYLTLLFAIVLLTIGDNIGHLNTILSILNK